MKSLFLVFLCCSTCVLSANDQTITARVVIVGAGAAGIAAASRLLENGFTNVTILEAEERIGGRIHSDQLGNYLVDLGPQWIVGEKGNVVFELAWPLGLIQRSNDTFQWTAKIFGSSGSSLSDEIAYDLIEFSDSLSEDIQQTDIDRLETGAFGEYANAKFNDYLESHPEISADLHEPLRQAMDIWEMATNAADSWHDLSGKSIVDYMECEGDMGIIWKNRTYSTILDVLMKKIPYPEEELPVLNNTHTCNEVTKIDYSEESEPVKVSTADGKEYLADHVIFTASLGVLKANHEQLFNPPLPEKKITTIENIGFGHTAKIIVYYENPWWNNDENQLEMIPIYWTDEDRKEIENDPKKKWMLGINTVMPIENKPKLLSIWISSNLSIEMESIPDELLRNQTLGFIHKFFGNEYHITEANEIKRSLWNSNEHFRGTYSYHGVKTDAANVTNKDLAEPIMRNDKPVLQFAGEATSEKYGTVHGAIDSGRREADRLINLYPKIDVRIIEDEEH